MVTVGDQNNGPQCGLWDSETRCTYAQWAMKNSRHLQVKPTPKATEIDAMFIQLPSAAARPTSGCGGGWLVVLPAGYGGNYWYRLAYSGAKAVGVKERANMKLEMQQPNFPQDFPDSKLYTQWAEDQFKQRKAQFIRRPPSKRPNYSTLHIASPFTTDFTHLATKQDTEDEQQPQTTPKQPTQQQAAEGEVDNNNKDKKEKPKPTDPKAARKLLKKQAKKRKQALLYSKTFQDTVDTTTSLRLLRGKQQLGTLSKILPSNIGLLQVNIRLPDGGPCHWNAHLYLLSKQDWDTILLQKLRAQFPFVMFPEYTAEDGFGKDTIEPARKKARKQAQRHHRQSINRYTRDFNAAGKNIPKSDVELKDYNELYKDLTEKELNTTTPEAKEKLVAAGLDQKLLDLVDSDDGASESDNDETDDNENNTTADEASGQENGNKKRKRSSTDKQEHKLKGGGLPCRTSSKKDLQDVHKKRDPIGFITTGGYCFSLGCCGGIGFVAANKWEAITATKQWVKKENPHLDGLVLLRNTNSHTYYVAAVSLSTSFC
eukprot:TRINITY_DN112996_c0_g1_i1.p1 TRINITY_DN112996_c0_g1~~TRINITY_DN112996_c0_g1_i1.p1  ORF type:complete len:581 (+),score=95.93 TRINITY_DN112996_c0_g1_i1:118-1743(+)